MTNVDRILAEAMKLSDEERATLADRLLEIVPHASCTSCKASIGWRDSSSHRIEEA
jgi:hypothetical protein